MGSWKKVIGQQAQSHWFSEYVILKHAVIFVVQKSDRDTTINCRVTSVCYTRHVVIDPEPIRSLIGILKVAYPMQRPGMSDQPIRILLQLT